MPGWYGSSVFDDGLNSLKSNTNKVYLVNNFVIGDSLATVITKSIANVDAASGEWTGPQDSGLNREVVFPSKSTTATAAYVAASGDLSFVACSASAPLAEAEETAEPAVANGQAIVFPALTFRQLQPA